MARVSRVSTITGDCSPNDWSRMLGDGLVRRGTARDRQASKHPTPAKEDVPRRIFVAVAKCDCRDAPHRQGAMALACNGHCLGLPMQRRP